MNGSTTPDAAAPAGFAVADCNISVWGAPRDYNYETHRGWRHFSSYATPTGTGWRIYAGVYGKISGSEFSAKTYGNVDYQIVCVD